MDERPENVVGSEEELGELEALEMLAAAAEAEQQETPGPALAAPAPPRAIASTVSQPSPNFASPSASAPPKMPPKTLVASLSRSTATPAGDAVVARRGMVGAVSATSAVDAGSDGASNEASATELEQVTGITLAKRPRAAANEVNRASIGRHIVKLAAVKAGANLRPLPDTWITAGIVVRKFDAKSGSKGGSYGVVRLWGFDGLCPESGTSVSLLLAGGAFTQVWSRVFQGDIVAVTNEVATQRDENQARSAAPGKPAGNSSSVLLKATAVGSVFVLGGAAGVKRCGVVTRNGDPCSSYTRAAAGGFCAFHAAAAAKAARAEQTAAAARGPTRVIVGPRAVLPKALQAPTLAPLGATGHFKMPSGPAAPALAAKVNPAALGAGQPRPPRPGHSEEFLCVRKGPGASGAVKTDGTTAARVTTTQRGQDAFLDAVARVPMRGEGLSPVVAAMPEGGAHAPRAPLQTTGQRMLVSALQQQQLRRVEEETKAAEAAARRARTEAMLGEHKRSRSLTADDLAKQHQPSQPCPPRSGLAAEQGTVGSVVAGTAVPPRSALPPARMAFNPLPGSTSLLAKSPKAGSLAQAVAATLKRGGESKPTESAAPLLGAKKAIAPKIGTPQPSPADLNAMAELRARAAQAKSRFDVLRQQDSLAREQRRLAAIEQEDAALEALDSVRSAEVTAFHCATCRRWTFTRTRTCVEQRHPITAGKTIKRYYRCRNCRFSLGHLAANGEPHRIPCPRCSASDWADGTAAQGRNERQYDQHGDLVVEPNSTEGLREEVPDRVDDDQE